MLFEESENRGSQVIKHDLYRRQDYRKCFHLSHYIHICKISEINRLNKNLYNPDTLYYPMERVLDIDTLEDYHKYIGVAK